MGKNEQGDRVNKDKNNGKTSNKDRVKIDKDRVKQIKTDKTDKMIRTNKKITTKHIIR